MSVSSNILPILDGANSFTNVNLSGETFDDNLRTNTDSNKRLILSENISSNSLSTNDIRSFTSDSDSSGAVLCSNTSFNSKTSESNSQDRTRTNNSCVTSEGYSTGHEDFSGFDGAPVSIEGSGFTKEGASDDDEYFEDFHMPNTHENAFVRHQSFRKKVQLTPINAPEADHIEGLVRTGSFRRHDSIRRKILHEEQESDFDDSDSVSNLSDQLRQDIEEIEKIILNESKMNTNANPTTFSTPISNNNSNESDPNMDLSTLDTNDCSLSLESNTMTKIRDCLNVSKHKSIYHLSGRLQDILTPYEIEEVLNNSEKYSSFLTAEVLEALSMSIHDDTINDNESGINGNGSSINVDKSGINYDHLFVPHEDANDSARSKENYKSCSSSLDLKVIEAPKLNLCNLDESESIEVSDFESPNTSEFLSSSDVLDESIDRTKNQRRISAKGLSFTSVSCYSAPSITSDDQIFAEEASSLDYVSPPFSRQGTDLLPLPPPDLIPEAEDALEENHWRNVVIAGDWKRIDMKAVNPYKLFISHGGFSDSGSQVIVISATLLPKKSLKAYNYIMDNLFMYGLSLLEQLASDDYVLVYLAGGRATSGPGFHWMRRAYDMIDRRIRKNMQQLLIVHPSLWARALVILSKPFISSKFYRKLNFIYNLTELAQIVPLTNMQIPDLIKQLDFELLISEKKRARRM